MKEPPGATLDPEFITFEAWIEKVEDVHYKDLAEDRNLEFGQTYTLSKSKTNICKRDILRAPPCTMNYSASCPSRTGEGNT